MPCGGTGNEWKTQVSKFLDFVFRSEYYAKLNIEQVKMFESIMLQIVYLLSPQAFVGNICPPFRRREFRRLLSVL